MRKHILGLNILVLGAALGSSVAFAHDKNKSFEDQKKEAAQMVDSKLASLQAAKTCFAGASDQGALEKCHDELRLAMKKCDKKCHCNHKGKKDDSKKEE